MHWLSAAHLLQLSLRFLHRHCVVSLVAACPAAGTRKASKTHTVFGMPCQSIVSRCTMRVERADEAGRIYVTPFPTDPHYYTLMHDTHERSPTHTKRDSETTRTALAVSAATPWRYGHGPMA